jgi:hypothetical protein
MRRLRIGLEAVGAAAPGGVRLIRVRPASPSRYPYGRPPRYRHWSRAWIAIAVRTRILVRVISRFGQPVPQQTDRPKNAYIREDRILPRLPALHLLLSGAGAEQRRRRTGTRAGADVRYLTSPDDVIDYLHKRRIKAAYDPAADTLHAGTGDAEQTITMKAS